MREAVALVEDTLRKAVIAGRARSKPMSESHDETVLSLAVDKGIRPTITRLTDEIKRLRTALAEAEARGRRQGLEEAAKAAEYHAGVADVALKYPLEPAEADRIHGVTVAAVLQHIRSLATAPAETQKPEETA
jgi:hypothetical protein